LAVAGRGTRRDQLIGVYTDMVNVYSNVLKQTTDWLCRESHYHGPLGRLVDAAARGTDPLSIITFNHDLIVENEIMKRGRLAQRWCAPDGYGTFGTRLQYVPVPTAPDAIKMHGPSCDHGKAIQVLKLHGSLNWRIRMNSRVPPMSLLTGADDPKKDVLLAPWRTVPPVGATVRRPTRGRGRTSWETWPLIVPPVHSKQSAISGFLASVWEDAREALRDARRLVLVGYSLPPTDVEAEKLFQRAVAQNDQLEEVEIVNTDPNSAGRFASVFQVRPIRWYPDLKWYVENEW